MTDTPHESPPPGAKGRTFDVVVLRQDGPGRPSYRERHRVAYEPDMNVISVLEKIAATARTADGREVAPVAWECNCLEEVCGACTMLVNGRVRQACTALVDRLLAEKPGAIELRPMTKFPVLRDLVVDRSRMFDTLERIEAWLPVDSYLDLGPGPRQPQDLQQMA
jgi:succinate dehydrogenase / fumarate reductase iron-sulfur subunit